MSELSFQILNLIRERKSINEIQEILKIGRKRLMIQLKSIVAGGYDFNKVVYPDGKLELNLKNTLKTDFLNINLEGKDELRALFISDLHLGRKKDKLKYLYDVYDYAAKNNIGIIFNLGDVVENVYHLPGKSLAKKTIEEQIEYVIKEYPFDKNIINIILYGNHDFYSMKNFGLNVGKVIENSRYDLINFGYMKNGLKMKNDRFFLKHDSDSLILDKNLSKQIVFAGHSHKMKNDIRDEIKTIYVPSLSDAVPSNYNYKPLKGFLDVNFSFEKELISKVYVKHQIIHYGIHQASESTIKIK